MNAELHGALSQQLAQADFAELIGTSESRVSQMLSEGVLERGTTGLQWLAAYTGRLRAQASGRDADGVLSRERAALSRSQRLGQDIRNRQAQAEWAPVSLLNDVLALAASAVVGGMDALHGQVRDACPDLPSEAHDTIAKTIASARREWVRITSSPIDIHSDLDQLSPAYATDSLDQAGEGIGDDDQ